jgi:hypothetical protein
MQAFLEQLFCFAWRALKMGAPVARPASRPLPGDGGKAGKENRMRPKKNACSAPLISFPAFYPLIFMYAAHHSQGGRPFLGK